MEDDHVHVSDLGEAAPGYGFFGRFDGHGGDNCAHVVAANFVEQITKQPGFSAAAKANDVEALKICQAGAPRSGRIDVEDARLQLPFRPQRLHMQSLPLSLRHSLLFQTQVIHVCPRTECGKGYVI